MSTIDIGIADQPRTAQADATVNVSKVARPTVVTAPVAADFYVGSVKIEAVPSRDSASP